MRRLDFIKCDESWHHYFVSRRMKEELLLQLFPLVLMPLPPTSCHSCIVSAPRCAPWINCFISRRYCRRGEWPKQLFTTRDFRNNHLNCEEEEEEVGETQSPWWVQNDKDCIGERRWTSAWKIPMLRFNVEPEENTENAAAAAAVFHRCNFNFNNYFSDTFFDQLSCWFMIKLWN